MERIKNIGLNYYKCLYKSIKPIFDEARNTDFNGSVRTVKVKRNITALFVIHSVNLVLIYLLVPLSLKYITPLEYGIWLTLHSILAWLNNADFGVGNGLRNKLAESLALKDYDKAKIYVSSSYFIFFAISLILIGIFTIIYGLINWTSILGTPTVYKEEINLLVFYSFLFFIMQIFLRLINAIVAAHQTPSVNGVNTLLINIVIVVAVFTLLHTTQSSLFKLGFASSAAPAVVLFLANIYLFNGRYKKIKPAFSHLNLKGAKDLFSLGINFFIIQIAVLIIFTANNLLIAQYLGPEQVAIYNIIMKYYALITLVFGVILTPFWSCFTEAFVNNDYEWIKQTIRKLILLWLLFSIAAIIMLSFSSIIIKLWIGEEIKISFMLNLLMALYVIAFNWNNIFAFFLNGCGKIKISLYYSIAAGILYIPLALFLINNLNMGIAGALTATLINLLPVAIWAPLQTRRILNKTAQGLWNK